jgi:hypothetical protein
VFTPVRIAWRTWSGPPCTAAAGTGARIAGTGTAGTGIIGTDTSTGTGTAVVLVLLLSLAPELLLLAPALVSLFEQA